MATETNYLKGSIGEQYVAGKISELGYKVLFVGGCQLFEITGNRFETVDLEPFGKGRTFWVQIKNKEPRKYYPDTGMAMFQYHNLINYERESGLPVLVLFTDSSQAIYGEWIKNLPQCISPYGNQYNQKDKYRMIYWLIDKLKNYKELI